jgi:hypothetical protein
MQLYLLPEYPYHKVLYKIFLVDFLSVLISMAVVPLPYVNTALYDCKIALE